MSQATAFSATVTDVTSPAVSDSCRLLFFELLDEEAQGDWGDVDDLNDREVKGVMPIVVRYEKLGCVILGQRFARQRYTLVKGGSDYLIHRASLGWAFTEC